jgi:hypothetical protein
MSVANLEVPNSYNLFANSLNLKEGIVSSNGGSILQFGGTITTTATGDNTVYTLTMPSGVCANYLCKFEIVASIIAGTNVGTGANQTSYNRFTSNGTSITSSSVNYVNQFSSSLSGGTIGQNIPSATFPTVNFQLYNNNTGDTTLFIWTLTIIQAIQ